MRNGVNILGINAYHGDASAVLLRDGELVPLEKIPGHEERHRVRPGLTGVAQVYASREMGGPGTEALGAWTCMNFSTRRVKIGE